MVKTILWLLSLIVLGGGTYGLTFRFYDKIKSGFRGVLWGLSLTGVFIWLLFDFYYMHIYDNWAWVFSLRSVNGIEFSVCLVGIFSALLQKKVNLRYPPKDFISRHNGFILFILLILPSFLKPILHPVKPVWKDTWTNNVCMQSQPYSCGPAVVATMLNYYDKKVTEEEVAKGVYLTAHGTEAWYMARYLRSKALKVSFHKIKNNMNNIPVPSIIATYIGGKNGIGHYITVVGETEDSFKVGDPIFGLYDIPKKLFWEKYHVAGFLMHVREK